MTKPTEADVAAARLKLEQIRKYGGTRCEREIAREWYKIVKEASIGFDGLASYVPLRARDVLLSDVYERFAAQVRRKHRQLRFRKTSVHRERLTDEV